MPENHHLDEVTKRANEHAEEIAKSAEAVKQLATVQTEIEGILQYMRHGWRVRAREGNGPEDALKSLAITVAKVERLLDRSEMAVALVKGYAIILRTCHGDDATREFAERISKEIDRRTDNVCVDETVAVLRGVKRFREIVARYATGEAAYPWPVVRDELAELCTLIDKAKL